MNDFNIHNWQAKFASKSNSKTITEGSIAIRTYKAGKKDPIGHVDTTLIDQLVAQIGPHVGYPDWENRLQLTTTDYQNIIQYISKQLTGAGTLQSDRVEFI